MTKPLVIYHDNCADGFGAAFAAWLALGGEAEYRPTRYGDAAEEFHATDREVFILDFSFPREVMDYFFSVAERVVWLDHHKTAFEMWAGGQERTYLHETEFDLGGGCSTSCHITLDNDKSGAMLAWEYFHPDAEAPMLVKHIDDYARWQFKIDGTKEFNKALWSYAPWSFEQWRDWVFQLDHNLDGPYLSDHITAPFIREGAAILRAHDQNVQAVVKGAARKCTIWFPTPYGGWRVTDTCMAHGLAANCPPHLTSDVGHELAVQSGTFGLCWTLNQTKLVANCSLRSNGGYDVSAIAKAFGGGGHKNAAGFEVPIATLLEWMA
ncbi:MAG: DHHA1 domain-containing protein [Gallionella sp.]|nr:DHHA1 domain-containing protein [Gallionella sp.]